MTNGSKIAKSHAETEFEKYRITQDRLFMSDYDRYIEQLLVLPENRDRKKRRKLG
jgi:hypothetical protein